MSVLTDDSSYGRKMRDYLKQFPVAWRERFSNFLERFDNTNDKIVIMIFAATAQEIGKLEDGLGILEKYWKKTLKRKINNQRYDPIDQATLEPMYRELGIASFKDYLQPQNIRHRFLFLTVASNSCYVRVSGEIPKDVFIFGRYYFRGSNDPYRIADDSPYPENGLLGVYSRGVVADADALAHKACEHGRGPYCGDDD